MLNYCVDYCIEAKTEKDLQSNPHPEGLYILLHTPCDSSPWGLSQNSGHYIVVRTPSSSLKTHRRNDMHERVLPLRVPFSQSVIFFCLYRKTFSKETGAESQKKMERK